ncbi:glycerophosphoryl diester phosphodiesterase [Nocardioides flavus (ex Wang et al. 2016)]|uniref:Glycerophosphoryl diester phosphodiesterase n=1 Tax=Nocardioides flavus (ex Wang et al. 2016) TaxID=2058780 RepID=A0ABQ3HIH5_9ACTN|nr:glycerophosphodiester phosphodiesterase family protein [Nocardioides flavus (ex Wang et al. 2016)]GHE15634.1 glycerophosphoryl diester phosphodiesterase [Nocardioides flavus (ex Wang et al. 2016)]
MTSYGDTTGPLAIAHRGGAGLAAENTLAAFARATALGLTHLETDVRTTRDGHVVCFHDATLSRVTGHPGRVADLDLADLRRLRVDGTDQVPTLREALATFPTARFAIDLKDEASIGAMARLLRAHPGWAERTLVAGAWSGWLRRLRDEAPGVTTALGWRSLTTLVACSRGGVRPPGLRPGTGSTGTFAHVPIRLGRLPVHSGRVIARAHELGIRVVVWTVDDPVTMRSLLDMGVDGIITDRPDVLREVLVARGEWTGAQTCSSTSAPRPCETAQSTAWLRLCTPVLR